MQGRGLFSGEMCRLSFMPAPENAGITFVRNDLPSPVRIETNVANLAKRARRTSLKNGAATVETIEHVLAAVWGLGIDNLAIELDAVNRGKRRVHLADSGVIALGFRNVELPHGRVDGIDADETPVGELGKNYY